jgi:hypothetical protein
MYIASFCLIFLRRKFRPTKKKKVLVCGVLLRAVNYFDTDNNMLNAQYLDRRNNFVDWVKNVDHNSQDL